MKTHTLAALKIGAAPLALGLAILPNAARAQDAPAADKDAPEATIVVTGTRIVAPNLTSAAPITTITADLIKSTGAQRTEDLLNSLPQVVASQTSTLANGASGTATVDLRGLGASRTLVLINGRRLMTGDPSTTTSAADLNFIPAALVKRVDVLTGGASATYGADAVAGVVNFVMDNDFTGFRVDGNYGFFQHNNRNKVTPPLLDARAAAGLKGYEYPKGSVTDGGQLDMTLAFGAKFDEGRGHFSSYFGYRKANAVLQARRDYSACTIQNTNARIGSALDPAAPLQCGGSATSATGTVFYHTSTTSSSTVGALGPGTLTQGTLNRYNFAPLNYFQRPDQRYTGGAFVEYEVSSAFKPYMELMFMDDRTVAQIAPSGNFGNTLTINCDNPLMSASQRSQLCQPNNMVIGYLGNFPLVQGVYDALSPTAQATVTAPSNPNTAYMQLLRRNVEGGPRRSDLGHTAFRAIIGSKGDLGPSWNYDAYFQYGRTNYKQVYSNEFSARRLTNALDVIRNSAGQIVCRSVVNGTDTNCVPYDVFGGNPSQAAISYLSATGIQTGNTTQQIGSAYLTGSLGDYGVKMPWAEDGVSVVIGAEYRKDSLELDTDNSFSTGDLTGQGAPTKSVAGSYSVYELVTEAEVPIVRDGFVKDLTFNGGYRYSHYKTSGQQSYNTNTYKLQLNFSPISDVRLRGSFNRAVRAPNIQELFAPQIVALDGSTDPCSGRPLTAADRGCLLQGLRVGQTVVGNPAAQYNGKIGGNPSLRPEVATTKTLGVVIQPAAVSGLSLSVDWFDIKVKGAIQGFGADAILAACTNDLNTTACSLIKRNPAGSLWLTSDGYVTDLRTNVGGVTTRGWEFNGNYRRDVGFGTLSLNVVGTLTNTYTVDNGLTAAYNCAGYFGPTCGGPLPKWRHRARLGLTTPGGFGVNLQWRHLGKVDVEYKNPSATLKGNFYNYSSRISAQNYFDLSASKQFADRFTLRIGVNNLFDREPPLVTSGSGGFGASGCASTVCNGNTYPGTYDALGRYIFTGVTMDF
ncbi:TonB-dependent receptor [Novosphingobium flavum]|uniref:TonB-dependent receptor domain-containing protein n=1 Tax=Novosphingobium aerophilum TaxID=2839843 RepID=UPI00163ACDC2|nr:TonB-dependent receptor [Novosphingobium aerophilum]MBC2662850.1 TonB-dependent receptor [Novosphingobium aerophilum]